MLSNKIIGIISLILIVSGLYELSKDEIKYPKLWIMMFILAEITILLNLK